MTSSDKGKKILSDLVKFKKKWTYRIYAEDSDWFTNFVQIYVNSNNNTNSSDSNDIIIQGTNDSSKNNDIENLLKELLDTAWNDYSWTQNDTNLDNEILRDISNEEIYISRSCKQYRIEYNQWLWVYTSPDLQKTEYFINKEYLKRYIDSKNPQKDWCPKNSWWISTPYNDNSENTDNYIAPNWKVYFISQQNWYFSSNELDKKRNFDSISSLKYFIRNRNPITWMSAE